MLFACQPNASLKNTSCKTSGKSVVEKVLKLDGLSVLIGILTLFDRYLLIGEVFLGIGQDKMNS